MTVHIPLRMATLPRERGLPVPWTVERDPRGVYRFAVNSEARRQLALHSDLCGICGQNLTKVRWFIGGPFSAFHPKGAYYDPPMHSECAHYALLVCPYLALSSYHRFVDVQKMAKQMDQTLVSNTMLPDRPPLFVAVRARGTIIASMRTQNLYIDAVHAQQPYLRVEYWRHGRRLARTEGEPLAQDYMRTLPLHLAPRTFATP